jgi:hypothetical protein
MPRRLFQLALIPLVFTLGGASLSGPARGKEPVGPPLEESVQVWPLGYRPPGSLYMLSGRAFSTLDFIDAHHLLFTFHQPRLMRRREHPGRLDNDQMIQAVVLSLPEGAVLESTEWRMHDRSRYLWPLAGGKFLVRQGNAYFLTDTSLKLHPYLDVASQVFETEVSADGHTLAIEHEFERHTPEQHAKLEAQSVQYGESAPAEDTQITLIDIATRKVLTALRTEMPIHLPLTDNGYVGVGKGKGEDEFLINFVPFKGESTVLGKVASTCTPRENFLNQSALFIESCGPKTPDAFLDVWTTDGKKLWSGHREGHLVWPTFAYAQTGRRFAVSTLRVAHIIDLADSLNDEDVREQVVQVFDSATGALLMSTNASPVLTAGQNFALSEDGERLAVLREGAIEVYKVPAPEQTPAALAQKK